MDSTILSDALHALSKQVAEHFKSLESDTLPVTTNLTSPPLLPDLPAAGLGTSETFAHLQSTIVPHLAQGHAGPRYYGIPW
jgi:hypothetical protein